MIRYAPMTEADLDAVAEAERRIYAFPWTRGNFADSLAAGHGAWLAQEKGCMTGYAVMMQALDEVHLLNITVLPEAQGAGRGSALLSHLIDLARMKAATRMLLEVRPGNTSGQGFYQRHGFVEIGRRRDYYPAHEGREDAIVMACEL
ncbi:MAG: ribosomal protein S18-alanine N-acetyltransferase [Rhodocyclales bacterium]|nr:ribosomal protein S18-alanine N-acetyltransferase [Rhodocyclales bacterium]